MAKSQTVDEVPTEVYSGSNGVAAEVDVAEVEEQENPPESELEEDFPEIQSNIESSPFGEWSKSNASSKPLKVLLYGPPGAGKTRMAATFPKPLFLDLESGLRSTLAVKSVLRYPSDPKEEINTYPQVAEFYQLVKKMVNPPFETIVIDSINELQVLVMNYVVGKYNKATRLYDDQFTQGDYGKANRDLLKIVRLFFKLPYHIVFTGVETPRTYPEQQVRLMLKGKEVLPELERLIEMYGYCHVKKGQDGKSEHLVSFHLNPLYLAKDRLNIKERDIPNDYESLAKYMNSENV